MFIHCSLFGGGTTSSAWNISRRLRRSWPFIAIALVAMLRPLYAQDITVSDPVLISPDPTLDEGPKFKKRLKPDYPPEERKSGELGYVTIERYVDASGGGRHLQVLGTHAPFQRAVEAEYPDWSVTPARRAGKPVDTAAWVTVIFNPASASTKAPDATPRLLEVHPVFISKNERQGRQSLVVPVLLQLDAAGAITHATPQGPASPGLQKAILDSLEHWKFAPARKAGQPVAAELVVPVICQSQSRAAAGKQTPPSVVKISQPEYPYAMRYFGLEGRVQLEYVVDTEGHVKNPVVVQSNNPAFEDPALEAIQKWTYKPGMVEGKPVNTQVRQEVAFHLEGGGGDAFRITKGDQSKLPPELRFDTSPKVRSVQIPVYPYQLRYDGVKGSAKATMLINPDGLVAGVKITSADRPEFGLALAAALEGYVFDPALKNGKPVSCAIGYEQQFSTRDLGDQEGYWRLEDEKKRPQSIVSANALDAPIKPRSRRSPVFPVTVGDKIDQGSALIECLIDANGRARLPRIVEASEPAFGYAAVQAIAAWRFDPPKVKGEEAIVRVRVPFNFQRKAAVNTAAEKPAQGAATTNPSSNP